MKRKILALALAAIAAMSIGCAGILETTRYTRVRHEPMFIEAPLEEQIEVSNYGELVSAIIDLINEHESVGQLIIRDYDGDDVEGDIRRASHEIMNYHPLGAYAVSDITDTVRRVVTFFEVDIGIEYKRTQEQINSIVNVATLRYMRTKLLSMMSDNHEEAVFRTSIQISEEEIMAMVNDTYYQNPRHIVMLPAIAIESFPETGNDRILEIRFGFIDSPAILRQYGDFLALYVSRNAELAVGDNDAEIILSLANNLIASTSFDEGIARAISVHGAQNFAATAFGALIHGSAVGEGFAMAFKALCDELGIDSQVVLGYHDGMVHAWNIVSLYGHFYHIDVAMGYLNGIEYTFMKTDSDFTGRYRWDRANTIRCDGPLTFEELFMPEPDEDELGYPYESEDAQDDEEPDNQPNNAAPETPAPPEEEIEEPEEEPEEEE